MSQHYFVSDLHLFSRRSQAEVHVPQLFEKAAQAKSFVLGGDIFDFRWSTLGNVSQTVNAAIGWLENLVQQAPECDFHFVLGNHDYNSRFIHALDSLASTQRNLTWHRYYLRRGDTLFMHGDAADKPASTSSSLHLQRQQWLHDETRSPLAHWAYDMAMQARLHHIAKLINRKQKVTARLLRYLEHIGHGPRSGLKHVYFGHTHCAMSYYSQGGILFHNGGAPMQGLDFQIVPVNSWDV